MRSSKSRSRSKPNRNRPSGGNILNRVFDSSGPEGKVRGTPQQIIDKYTQLARDAQLSNDRVAFENFQQHAEHYTRLLGEAQREQDAKREQHERQQQQQQQQRERQQEKQERQDDAAGETEQGGERRRPQGESPEGEQRHAGSDDVIDTPEQDSNLVETPESKPAKPRRSRRKSPPTQQESSGETDGEGGESGGSDAQQAAE